MVRGGEIVSISPVPFNRETVERSHLISDEAEWRAAELTGIPPRESTGIDAVKILRERLP